MTVYVLEAGEETLAHLIELGLVVDSGRRNAAGEILWTLVEPTRH
jgi:hypothetical protein